MNRHVWLLLSGSLWAVMMFFLFQQEIRPYFEYQAPPSYRQSVGRVSRPEVQKRAVFLGRERIGDAESLVDPTAPGGPLLRSRFLMHLKPFGFPVPGDDRVYVGSDLHLDAAFELVDVRMQGQWQSIPFQMRGDRQEDRLRVVFELKPLFRMERMVTFPREATLSDSFLPYLGGVKMAEGRKWKMKLFDVEGLASASGKSDAALVERYAAVTGRDLLELRGREVAAYRIEVRKEPNDERWAYLVWVDEEGTVLKQQSKLRGLICEIVLEEKRALSSDEARAYVWTVTPP
jgi:hypothetical protein